MQKVASEYLQQMLKYRSKFVTDTHTDGNFFIAFLESGTLKRDISAEKSIC
ncbi:hypothetical protein O3M35_001824 [Rhynocoris fuscipes]|uniref:Uncharacterized protein n=1 Tax=Rhynocoris fuscipes TaxID=488301 RepID=A0AAW1CRD4_9HEMI